MSTSGCGTCGADSIEACICNMPITLAPGIRARVHAAVDRWLDSCEPHARERYDEGLTGHVGRFKLRAYVDDDNLCVSYEHTLESEL